jgi:hypothetical protein
MLEDPDWIYLLCRQRLLCEVKLCVLYIVSFGGLAL